ncbi:CaiB/BaiF CoA transferase family protein [Nocardioides humi]|uniref:CaiB/BaiF CoA-transferase family protein n=1 Tax=Nocardioides humi TaxID=449461 RepID=A0ABN2AGK1_9ACTN|nr:CaiB/BaiF CoA-transferase family protein [Nocardioides humi]
MTGPLAGLRVLELGALGPSAYATMLLADLGAEVVRVDRPAVDAQGTEAMDPALDFLNRGKQSVAIDLKHPDAAEAVLTLVENAQIVTEGYRPGVAERLGLGPDACLARNPALVYARMTGWGQDGPLAAMAGHDINYISLTGALHAVGPADGPPVPPVNFVGDWGGGGMYLVAGVLAALREAERSGTGQVVDVAIVDGVLHMLSSLHSLLAQGLWVDERGANALDGAAPYYGVYETADGEHMAVGAGEVKFYARLVAALGLDLPVERQYDRGHWSEARAVLADAFRARTRTEWTAFFADIDCCVTPVLSLRESAEHPHVRARGSVVDRDGRLHSGPAPRFSRSTAAEPTAPPVPGQHTVEVLAAAGLDPAALIDAGVAVSRAD